MIYFVRHGESEANERGIFASQKEDSPLNEKGREQAMITAQQIMSEGIKIDRVVSSPLKRAFETAEIIAKELGFSTSKIVIDEGVTEYDMGSLTGTPIHKISSRELISAQNAEDTEAFRNRVYLTIKEFSKSPENILIVSHAGVGRILETIKTGADTKLFYDLPAYPNASVNKIDWI